MITVKEIMSDEVIYLTPSDSLTKAQDVMLEHAIRHIPIVESGALVGVVSERDVLKANISSLQEATDTHFSDSIHLGDIMIKSVKIVQATDSLRTAGLIMERNKFGCLPVLENQTLVGIVTDADFVGVAINLLEQMESYDGNEDEALYNDDL